MGGQQTIEEAYRVRPELGEAFPQQNLLLAGIGAGPMSFVFSPLPGYAAREEAMAANFLDRRTVDNQFGLGDAHRQCLADVTPGRGIGVLEVGDIAFHVDHAVDDVGDAVRGSRQSDQVRSFLGVAVDGPLFGLAVNTRVGDLGQPPCRDLIELLERVEGTAIEKIGLDVEEGAFDLALRLTPPDAASLGCKAIVGGKGEELRVIERPFVAMAQHNDLHVVV